MIQRYLALVVGKGLQLPLLMVFMSLMTRVLTPADVAQWSMVVAAASLMSSFLFSWMSDAYVRFGREEWVQCGTDITTKASLLPMVTVAWAVALVIIFLDPVGWLEKVYHLNSSWHGLVFVSLLGLFCMVLTRARFQLKNKMMGLALLPVIVSFCLVLYLLLIHHSRGFDAHVVISRVIEITAGIWTVASLFALGLRSLPSISLVMENKKKSSRIITYAWPLIPGMALTYMSVWGDRVILQWMTEDASSVGLLHIADIVFNALLGIAIPVSTILAPSLIEKNIDNKGAGREFLSEVLPSAAVVWLLFILWVLVFLPSVFLALVGDRFAGSLLPLSIMTIGIPGSFIAAACSPLYSVQQRLKHSIIYYNGIDNVLHIIALFLLIPHFGMIGAAAVVGISYLGIQLCYLIDQHRYLKVPVRNIILVHVIVIAFAVAQVLCLDHLLIRILLGMAATILICLLSRSSGIVREEMLAKRLPERLRILIYLLVRKA